MNIAASLCMLALAAIAAWAVLGPYQRTRAWVPPRLADPLEDERGRALRHLRDLDDDRACGKLDEARYQLARADAEARAVVLRALEARERTGELAAGLRGVRAAQPRAQAQRARPRGAGRWLPASWPAPSCWLQRSLCCAARLGLGRLASRSPAPAPGLWLAMTPARSSSSSDGCASISARRAARRSGAARGHSGRA